MHLDEPGFALVAAAFLDYEREQAKGRMLAGVNLPVNLREGSNGEASAKAGARLGVSGSNVERAEKIIKLIPHVG